MTGLFDDLSRDLIAVAGLILGLAQLYYAFHEAPAKPGDVGHRKPIRDFLAVVTHSDVRREFITIGCFGVCCLVTSILYSSMFELGPHRLFPESTTGLKEAAGLAGMRVFSFITIMFEGLFLVHSFQEADDTLLATNNFTRGSWNGFGATIGGCCLLLATLVFLADVPASARVFAATQIVAFGIAGIWGGLFLLFDR